jgi:hypothetical protein
MVTPGSEAPVPRHHRNQTAALCWFGAAVGVVFLVATIISGRLTLVNLSVFLLVIISLGGFGILALSGDLAWSDRDLDEGQIAASRSAQSLAFAIGYLGIIGLWMSYLFMPAWAMQAPVHLGILAVVVTGIWLGTWAWGRWHP